MPVSRTSTSAPRMPIAAAASAPLTRDDDLAALGELDRVGQQVEHDLAQPAEVADHGRRQVVRRLVGELDALAPRPSGR